MDYEKLLEKGMKEVPKHSDSGERFEVPKADVEKAGRRTIINNIFDIASALRRDPSHVIKFLLKELATKGDIVNQRLFVLGSFGSEMIGRKIDMYVKLYVACQECGKPDTKMLKEEKTAIIKCEACGARHPVS